MGRGRARLNGMPSDALRVLQLLRMRASRRSGRRRGWRPAARFGWSRRRAGRAPGAEGRRRRPRRSRSVDIERRRRCGRGACRRTAGGESGCRGSWRSYAGSRRGAWAGTRRRSLGARRRGQWVRSPSSRAPPARAGSTSAPQCCAKRALAAARRGSTKEQVVGSGDDRHVAHVRGEQRELRLHVDPGPIPAEEGVDRKRVAQVVNAWQRPSAVRIASCRRRSAYARARGRRRYTGGAGRAVGHERQRVRQASGTGADRVRDSDRLHGRHRRRAARGGTCGTCWRGCAAPARADRSRPGSAAGARRAAAPSCRAGPPQAEDLRAKGRGRGHRQAARALDHARDLGRR